MAGKSQKIIIYFSILAFVITALPVLAKADDVGRTNILFVFSWHKDMPWQKEIEKGFKDFFQERPSKQPNLFYEYMDAGRFKRQNQIDIFYSYLKEKYAGFNIDYIIYESSPAAKFFKSYPKLFANSKNIIINPGPVLDGTHLDSSTVIPVNVDYDGAAQKLLAANKDTKIYLVAGATENADELVNRFMDSISKLDSNRMLVPLVGLPMPQLLEKVATLDSNSLIFYLLIFKDGLGTRFIPYDAAIKISQQARVPVYTLWTSLLGSGVLGGYMLSGEKVGQKVAKLLTGPGLPMDTYPTILAGQFHGNFYDWQQLERWDVNENSLPAGSQVLFKERLFFELYYRELIVIIAITVLVFFFVRNRELKSYNIKINTAHRDLQRTNTELSKTRLALEKKNQQLEKLSVTDRLTGLYNRGYLDDFIYKYINHVERYGGGLSIIMVDIDHFKSINDNHGHQIGDEVLVNISKIMKSNIRTTDVIGRWGGEEFLIVCPECNEKQTVLLAEKLRTIIQQTSYGPIDRVTCSFGVSSYDTDADINELIKTADTALYLSKKYGRNRVSTVEYLKDS